MRAIATEDYKAQLVRWQLTFLNTLYKELYPAGGKRLREDRHEYPRTRPVVQHFVITLIEFRLKYSIMTV